MAPPIDAVLADAARLTAAGRPQAAIDALRPAIAENPDHPGAWCGLAAAFLDVGEAQRCLDAAKRAITLGEPAWAHRLASLALTELGRHEEAAISARESARRSPGDWRGYVTLAEALAPIAPADALTAARRAVSIAPEEPRTHEVLGATAEKAGEADTARGAYQEALRLDPDNAEVRAALARVGRRNGGGRFGDVPWERVTAWQEAVPDQPEPDWTLVDVEQGRFPKDPRRKAKRPAAARTVHQPFAVDDHDTARETGNGSGQGSEAQPPVVEESPRERVVRDADGPRPRRVRFGRAQRIGLWLALRRSSGWLAIGGFVLMIAGMPEPTRLLAWFSAALVLTVVALAGVTVFRLPADLRLTPAFLWERDKLMAVGAGAFCAGAGLLAVWTAALALGAGGLSLLTPVVILGLLAFAVGTLGMWRLRHRR